MNCHKKIVSVVVLFAIVFVYAENVKKEIKTINRRELRQQRSRRPIKEETVVEKPSAKPELSMQSYINDKVAELEEKLIDDIFPKKGTIERVVLEFKVEFPGPNKDADIELIYNAIINNSEIKKRITLENAVPVYRLLKETIGDIWKKQDDEIWSK
jgi:hypothetical protein